MKHVPVATFMYTMIFKTLQHVISTEHTQKKKCSAF